ncbi:MAG: hypothetical protein ACXW2U_11015 [Telluria sp.]
MGIFRRTECSEAFAGLGAETLALRITAPRTVPPSGIGVSCDRHGVTHRVAGGGRIAPSVGGGAWCFHPGPYTVDLAPFKAAPEAGIRLVYVVDSADPRVSQQRFDLFLASECGDRLDAAQLGAMVESAVRRELAQGNLELPPCATLPEWDVFRAGFDELLYTRFGVTAEACAPVDLAESRGYAAMLLARTVAAEPAAIPAAPGPAPQAGDDARALRRLFLELPRIASGLRQAQLPAGLDLFRQQQSLLQRIGVACLSVETMPALELAAPGIGLHAGGQARRIGHSLRAQASLDEAWALLARLKGDAPVAAIFDEADRIVSNLEHDCAARRVAGGGCAT